jgi:peptide-methionine (S)-S-oxide reductase
MRAEILIDKGSKMTQDRKLENATFGAGCFWGVELLFQKIDGVVSTQVGYEGGFIDNPAYEDVCTDETGHAEVVEIQFDPSVVSYEELLAAFWKNHNPTTLNQQGFDVGTQYRSVIYYHTPKQESAALTSKDDLQNSGHYTHDIVTEITPAATFFKAEEYHQRYLQKKGKDSCGI